MNKLSVTVDLEILFDNVSNTFQITKTNAKINNLPSVIKMTRTLQVAEKRYGILTLGSKSAIGKVLPFDEDITVVFDGKIYPAHSHKAAPGRIDRLSSIMKQFHVNTSLQLEYNTTSKELHIYPILNKDLIVA